MVVQEREQEGGEVEEKPSLNSLGLAYPKLPHLQSLERHDVRCLAKVVFWSLTLEESDDGGEWDEDKGP